MSLRTGVWLLPEDAAEYLGVGFSNDRQFIKDSELDRSRYIERGSKCSSGSPFIHFSYVCVLKDAPDGWEASSNTRLSLGKFLSMCADLSDTNNQVSPGSVVSQNFEKYSGYSYTPENVRLAFEQKILYSSDFLNRLF